MEMPTYWVIQSKILSEMFVWKWTDKDNDLNHKFYVVHAHQDLHLLLLISFHYWHWQILVLHYQIFLESANFPYNLPSTIESSSTGDSNTISQHVKHNGLVVVCLCCCTLGGTKIYWVFCLETQHEVFQWRQLRTH